MNIEKAIDKLWDLECYAYEPETQEALDALELGREALSFIRLARVTTPGSIPALLHGETDQ